MFRGLRIIHEKNAHKAYGVGCDEADAIRHSGGFAIRCATRR